jgi:hypothetical protein
MRTYSLFTWAKRDVCLLQILATSSMISLKFSFGWILGLGNLM